MMLHTTANGEPVAGGKISVVLEWSGFSKRRPFKVVVGFNYYLVLSTPELSIYCTHMTVQNPHTSGVGGSGDVGAFTERENV